MGGIFNYLIFTPVLALGFTWMYSRTGGILLLALVLHTMINNTGRVLAGTDWSNAVMLGLALVLIFTERMWRRRTG